MVGSNAITIDRTVSVTSRGRVVGTGWKKVGEGGRGGKGGAELPTNKNLRVAEPWIPARWLCPERLGPATCALSGCTNAFCLLQVIVFGLLVEGNGHQGQAVSWVGHIRERNTPIDLKVLKGRLWILGA